MQTPLNGNGNPDVVADLSAQSQSADQGRYDPEQDIRTVRAYLLNLIENAEDRKVMFEELNVAISGCNSAGMRVPTELIKEIQAAALRRTF